MESTCRLGAQSIFLFLSLENLLTALEETGGESPSEATSMGTGRVMSGRERGQSLGEVETGLTAICCQGCAERMPGSPLTVLVILKCLETLKENTWLRLLTFMVEREDGRESSQGGGTRRQWVWTSCQAEDGSKA